MVGVNMDLSGANQRMHGLDVCRILAMMGILILHIPKDGMNSFGVDWLKVCAKCSVDLFAMLSGYLGIRKKKYSYYRLVELLLIVLTYSIVITLLLAVLNPVDVDGVGWFLKGVFPPLVRRYWYITCFVPVLLFQPFINIMLRALTIRQHGVMCLLMIGVFCVVPSALNVDFFRILGGESFVWLLCCYVLGTFLSRLCQSKEKGRIAKFWGGGCPLLCVTVFVSISFLLTIGNYIAGIITGEEKTLFISHDSIAVLGMAIVTLVLYSQMRIRECRIIRWLSDAAFDVYIIHAHIHLMKYATENATVHGWIKNLPSILMPVTFIGYALLIYLLCALIFLLRRVLFKVCCINNIARKIASILDRLIPQMEADCEL